jgi:cell cycle arrest protein BUB3
MSLPEAKPLPDPPTDGITALKFLPSSPALLASSSWDGAVRIHDTEAMSCQLSHVMDSGPLLSLAVPAADVVAGGIDGSSK